MNDQQKFPLASEKIIAFVITGDPARAKAFYGGTLGLTFVSEDSFAIVFNANGTLLRIAIGRNITPAKHTVLGWKVHDITAAADALQKAGVKFERFEGLPQDPAGIWNAPGGDRVAWFKDPDGNILSISQHH